MGEYATGPGDPPSPSRCVGPAPYRESRARKLIPSVPNDAALDACGAPANTSSRQVISNPSNPAATTVASSSASSRAPAIQPVQSSMRSLAFSGTARVTRMSAIWSLPPGRNTRLISANA